MHRVLISLSSYGAAEVRRHGQLWFARLAQAAGADGVEVRGELLTEPAAELPALGAALREGSLQAVYSSPEGLWRDDGTLDDGALERGLAAAAALGAPRLKMAIGGFDGTALASLRQLHDRLESGDVELLIENDQTTSAGTLDALRRFLARAADAGPPPGVTFDMGNWHWTGECPLQAAAALAPHVRYVHCKGVQRQPRRWIAVPLADSAAPWRAVLRALPADVPWAIEYPLAGDDLLATTRNEISLLRSVAAAQAQAAA
ncbi:sugar phosphate isomerase/epimerase family protein [Ramlibacter sp.]|uniref:sugar phosphate isomerase/epimerase family protein n=1 Tax=Ramlibacter sp. TaxID=1917967 RepID=UPI002B92A193|nr:TIM barrel protein [Ramlibacter sp.]HWI82747.1 TIM barrel protein [Ramlibacter sp.]